MRDIEALSIPEDVKKALKKEKISQLLPVQEASLDLALAGKNLLVQSPTGSGKTLAFLIPLLEAVDLESRQTQALIILPTRELAAQIHQVLGLYKPQGLRQVLLIGGASKERQKKKMKKKPHVVIGTPGRIRESIDKKQLKTEGLTHLLIDEADKLADEAFYEGVYDLMKPFSAGASVWFFSATVTHQAREMMDHLGLSYERVQMTNKLINQDIRHVFTMAEDKKKFPLMLELARRHQVKRAIIFITRNAGVKGLAGRLQKAGLAAEGIHSGLSSQDRKRLIGLFRSGKVDFLVTTDIFARGMDVPDVDYIINYDLPKDERIYIHRAGRTARAGRKGITITFVEEEKKFVIRKFERKLDIKMTEKGLTRSGDWIKVDY